MSDSSKDWDREFYRGNTFYANYNNTLKTYRFSAQTNTPLPERVASKDALTETKYNQPRITIDEQGYTMNHTSMESSNTSNAKLSIQPSNLALSFIASQDHWDIQDVCDYLGRRCVVVRGTTADDYYVAKLKVISFTMVIDIKTGILLEFEGYSSSNKLVQYIRTTQIKIDDPGIDVLPKINVDFDQKYQGYKDVLLNAIRSTR